MNDARDGLQSGADACAFIKVRPRAASLSRFGVLVCALPPMGPIQLFKSSEIMSRILGFCGAGAASAEKNGVATTRYASNRICRKRRRGLVLIIASHQM